MNWTNLIFLALVVWMLWMHLRPGGHGCCGGRGSHSHSGGEPDGR